MKKMTTMITENGKEKRISVWLDERTAEALEQANDASPNIGRSSTSTEKRAGIVHWTRRWKTGSS